MVTDLTVDVDLEFSLDIPGSRTVTGSLSGFGKTLELRVSDPFLFGGRTDAGAIRGLAQALAGRGLSVSVVSPAGPLVTLGVADVLAAAPDDGLAAHPHRAMGRALDSGSRTHPVPKRRRSPGG